MKKLLIVLLTAAAFAANAAVIFDGATDSIYKATTNNANISLTVNSGNATLSNDAGGSGAGAYIFGNFSPVTLAVGDTLTLSFKITSAPPITGLYLSLGGVRGGILTSADNGYNQFSRSYAGFRVYKQLSNINITFNAWNGGNANATTQDRVLLGSVTAAMGTASTTINPGRWDSGESAEMTFTVQRTATQWFTTYTIDIVEDGSPLQSFTSSYYTPAGDYFQFSNAFTTFAIGAQSGGGFDTGEALQFSDIQVSYIPEPATVSLLLGAGSLLVLLGRRPGRR